MKRLVASLAVHTASMTPERTALLFALGFVLGTFPLLGIATVLCAIAALVLRLNMPALQIVSQIVTPLQYALLVPLSRLGGRMCGSYPGVAGAAVQAVAGWCCVCVPAGCVLYVSLVFLFRCRARDNVLETTV